MESKTVQESTAISAHDVVEAMEQIRAGFTISRITLGAVTLLYALKKKGDAWAKKFTKIQNEYHKFLLDTYSEMETELAKMETPKEEENK